MDALMFVVDWPWLITILIVAISARGAYVLFETGKSLRSSSSTDYFSTLIVLGSGGHTAEMLNLVRLLKRERFRPRYYVAAATDTMSLDKAKVLEESECKLGNAREIEDAHFMRIYRSREVGQSYFTSIGTTLIATAHALWLLLNISPKVVLPCVYFQPGNAREIEDAHFMRIYRSREVGQSYFTSIGTTLIATAHALWLLLNIRPKVILCNGPGTCIPLCVIAFLLKFFGIRWSSIFYVESIARVRRFSLSGLILYKSRMADQVLVQWPQLQDKYSRAQYVGCLM